MPFHVPSLLAVVVGTRRACSVPRSGEGGQDPLELLHRRLRAAGGEHTGQVEHHLVHAGCPELLQLLDQVRQFTADEGAPGDQRLGVAAGSDPVVSIPARRSMSR